MHPLAEQLEAQIDTLGVIDHLWVAFSGGVDSSLLLHLASQTRWAEARRLRVIHVHHGLQAEADSWAERCARICAKIDVPLLIERVSVPAGASLEAQARAVRYDAFERCMGPRDLLLLGQHADDQAETLLLRLMRGAGIRGAAAMPLTRSMARGRLLRPLLTMTRAEIEALARAVQLDWIDDPSNQDRRLRRNYLRHEVLPRLRAQWPMASQRLVEHAAQQQEQLKLLDEYAAGDAVRAAGAYGWSLKVMGAWSPPRQLQLMSWLLRQVVTILPEQNRLSSFRQQLFSAVADRQPSLRWRGWRLVRFRDELCLHRELPHFEQPVSLTFRAGERVTLPGGVLAVEAGLPAVALSEGAQLQIQPRQGGERLRHGGHERSLKKLLQGAQLPPWHRDQLPLVFSEQQLVAVADRWLDDRYATGGAGQDLTLRWLPERCDFQLSAAGGSANL